MTSKEQQTFDFIQTHLNEDVSKLLLSAKKYPEFDMSFVVTQIQARQQIKEKLPDWYQEPYLILPSRIAAEQCSSVLTAKYKQRLFKGESLCDLTGGMGVDSYYFSKVTKKSFYIERFHEYCQAAKHNFEVLEASNIEVIHADSLTILSTLPPVDTIYLDPARRNHANKRMFALEDCEPDITQIKEILLQKSSRVIVKISPMADITQTMKSLPETSEIHVISVKNECKELLFVLENHPKGIEPLIHCVNFKSDNTLEEFSFTLQKERELSVIHTDCLDKYLYEPNVSILKAGAFNSICAQYNILKIHPNSHLYTSENLVQNFPGRVFEITNVHPFKTKGLKKLGQSIPKANITVRNFPMTVNEIRKKSSIQEGGEIYLFATTLLDKQYVILECKKNIN